MSSLLEACRARLNNSNALEAAGEAFVDHSAVQSPFLKGSVQGQQTLWRVTGVAITHKFAEAEVREPGRPTACQGSRNCVYISLHARSLWM